MKLRHIDGPVVLTVIFLFLASMCMHAQSVTPVNGPTYQPYSNPQHASQHDLAPQQTLLGNNSVTEAHGERPLWEFPDTTPVKSLGDVAREYRAEHAKLSADDKAQIHWNQ